MHLSVHCGVSTIRLVCEDVGDVLSGRHAAQSVSSTMGRAQLGLYVLQGMDVCVFIVESSSSSRTSWRGFSLRWSAIVASGKFSMGTLQVTTQSQKACVECLNCS